MARIPDDIIYKMPTGYDQIEDEINRNFVKNLIYAIAEMYRDIAQALNRNYELLTLEEKSADPDDPDEGKAVIWMSDGTGAGDDGDLMCKITAGGATKTGTLVDFSAI